MHNVQGVQGEVVGRHQPNMEEIPSRRHANRPSCKSLEARALHVVRQSVPLLPTSQEAHVRKVFMCCPCHSWTDLSKQRERAREEVLNNACIKTTCCKPPLSRRSLVVLGTKLARDSRTRETGDLALSHRQFPIGSHARAARAAAKPASKAR